MKMEDERGPYSVIRQFHQFRDQLLLWRFVWLSGNHVSDCLVERVHLARVLVHEGVERHERVYLLRRKVNGDSMQQP